MRKLFKKQQGFTIIEVMIVLAIAGLIMAVVFIAVPQLSRNARDNQRESIANRLKAEMETYASNNQGKYPFDTAATCTATTSGCFADFYGRYVNGKVVITDPSTGTDVINGSPGTTASATASFVAPASATPGTMTMPGQAGVVGIVYGAKCAGENLAASGSAALNTKNYAVVIGLDRAGTRYCVDNG